MRGDVQMAAVSGVFSVMVRDNAWSARRRMIESRSFVDINDGVMNLI